MSTIVRRSDYAGGGITDDERDQMKEHADLWTKRIMRTEPIAPDRIIPAIESLYRSADLEQPKNIVIVPSPLVVSIASGFAAAIWNQRRSSHATRAATYDATRAATYDATDAATYDATLAATLAATDTATDDATYDATAAATRDATRAATDAATRDATDDATRDATSAATDAATRDATHDATYAATVVATYAATRDATYAATRAATRDVTYAATRDGWAVRIAEHWPETTRALMVACARSSWRFRQGGNHWGQLDSYITAARDVLGLRLPEHATYSAWEQCAIHGSWRAVHADFCMVSDFPELIRVDENQLPHCEDGPSHRWRDEWELFYWHGTRVEREWIMDTDNIDPSLALTWENIEERHALAEIIGWEKVLDQLKAKPIHRDDFGELLQVNLPNSDGPSRFVRVRCATERDFAIPVPLECDTALAAVAWTYNMNPEEYRGLEVRT